MNYKNLGTLLLLCFVSMSHIFAQEDKVQSAILLVTYKNPTNPNKREKINLMGEKAYQFDVADFLNKNKFEDVQVNGGAMVNNEKLSWQFNSSKLEQPLECTRFCQVITAVDKAPFLGVGVVAMDDFSGARITKIVEGSSAEKYGLQIGDVITLINEYEIFTPCDLTKTISKHNAGDVLEIDIIRDEKSEVISSVLGYRLHKKLSWKTCCDTQQVVQENSSNINTWNADLSIFPNPTDGIAQVKYTATLKGDIRMNITDLTGRVIFSKKINEFDGFYNDVIDLTREPSGVYFLNVIQEEEVRTEKIVLQKL